MALSIQSRGACHQLPDLHAWSRPKAAELRAALPEEEGVGEFMLPLVLCIIQID